MNRIQSQQLKMINLVQVYLETIVMDIWNEVPRFMDYQNELISIHEKLQVLHQVQTQNIKGFTVNKANAREALCDFAVMISEKIMAYAVNTNNEALYINYRYSKSLLVRMNELKFDISCQIIFDKAMELYNELDDYGVDNMLMDQFESLRTEFTAVLGSTKNERKKIKLVTHEINRLFKKAIQLLFKMDVLVRTIEKNHPEIVKGYFENRAFDRPSYRHYSIRILIMDEDNLPLEGAAVSCNALEFKRKSLKKGEIRLKNIPEGNYVFTVSKKSYLSKKITVLVNSSERTEVKVVLFRL